MRTFEDLEKAIQYNKSLTERNGPPKMDDPYSFYWNHALIWMQNKLACIKEHYVLKNPIDTKPEPVKPIPFKVGQTLRRTSDGLKCMIVQTEFDYVYMVQLNNGKQFAGKIHFPGLDITPQALQQISGGYTFVTETKGREMGLPWAKEEARRQTTYCDGCGQPGAYHINGQCPLKGGLTNREFGGGTYSQH